MSPSAPRSPSAMSTIPFFTLRRLLGHFALRIGAVENLNLHLSIGLGGKLGGERLSHVDLEEALRSKEVAESERDFLRLTAPGTKGGKYRKQNDSETREHDSNSVQAKTAAIASS